MNSFNDIEAMQQKQKQIGKDCIEIQLLLHSTGQWMK